MNCRKMISGAAIVGAAFAAAPARGEADAPGKAAIEGFAAALNAHDIKAFAELFADDYVNHQISAAAPPPSGKSAKTATVDFFAARLNALPDLRVGVEASLAQGDLAAASFVYEGAHGANYYGVAPTGRRLRFTSCDIFRVRDGRIVEHWGMGDIAGVLAQLRG